MQGNTGMCLRQELMKAFVDRGRLLPRDMLDLQRGLASAIENALSVNILNTEDWRRWLRENAAAHVSLLVSALDPRFKDLTGRADAACALAELACYAELRGPIASHEAVPALYRQLRDTQANHQGRVNAAWALARLARDRDVYTKIQDAHLAREGRYLPWAKEGYPITSPSYFESFCGPEASTVGTPSHQKRCSIM